MANTYKISNTALLMLTNKLKKGVKAKSITGLSNNVEICLCLVIIHEIMQK